MFGIIRPCRHSLPTALREEWLGHLCGMCLSLRDRHGHAARLVTNYDGLIISALVQAQLPVPVRRPAGPCALRGMRGASVAVGVSAELAATVSLVLAAAKLRDHIADGDGLYGRRPVAAGAGLVARRWADQARRAGRPLGLDTGVLLAAVAEQRSRELAARPGTSPLAVTEPAETATAAAFAHTAVLAGRPENAEPLAEAGRLFGRIAHLVDAAEDLDADRRVGAWNPLTATGTPPEEAARLARDAVAGVRPALREVSFARPTLVHALLVHELEHAVTRTFTAASHPPVIEPGRSPKRSGGGSCWWPRAQEPPRGSGALVGCAIGTWMCCTCQVCCREEWPGPWSGRRRSGLCHHLDCSGCDCCDCCRCPGGSGRSGGSGCDCCCDCDCGCCGCD